MKKILSVQERQDALQIVLEVRKVLTRVSSVMRSNYYAAREEIKNDGCYNVYLFDAYFCEVYDCFNDDVDLYDDFTYTYEGTAADVIETFQDVYSCELKALPCCLQHAINWDDVISDFISYECFAVNYNNDTYYFRNV
jgi:hypothetical protein|nr:MAG TPA: hypothetical protein [Caudoviricetes sp.]